MKRKEKSSRLRILNKKKDLSAIANKCTIFYEQTNARREIFRNIVGIRICV